MSDTLLALQILAVRPTLCRANAHTERTGQVASGRTHGGHQKRGSHRPSTSWSYEPRAATLTADIVGVSVQRDVPNRSHTAIPWARSLWDSEPALVLLSWFCFRVVCLWGRGVRPAHKKETLLKESIDRESHRRCH